jgi:hypothetical protein
MHAGAFALAAVLAGCAPPDRPRLAEVLYDATGDDTNAEFVELLNPLDRAFPLAGLRIEAGDGANPGRWTLRWTGTAADSVAAHGRFVIGGSLIAPSPNAVVNLALQNGPDAVRLVWPDGAIEVLGYGAVSDPSQFCGTPAVDAPSGFSLARIPDDADLGANARDFRAAPPTPGRANLPAHDLAVVAGSLALTPEHPPEDAPASLAVRVCNRGATGVAAGEAALALAERMSGVVAPLASAPIDRGLAAGETLAVTIAVPGRDPGKRWLVVRTTLAGDENPANDADSLLVRIGPGPVEVTEIQFHPAAGEGEWVELRGRDAAPVEIATLRLGDRTSTRGAPPDDAPALARDALAVLAQDRRALLDRFPALDSTRVLAVTPWPGLNNTDDATGVADEVALYEDDGAAADRVAYSARGVPAGTPIERTPEGLWRPSPSPEGTPLEPPRVLPPQRRRLELGARRLDRAAHRMRVSWSLPWPRAIGTLALHDLAGRRVTTVLDERELPGRGDLDWDAGALPGGLYLVVLLAHDPDSGASLSATAPVRVEGPAR